MYFPKIETRLKQRCCIRLSENAVFPSRRRRRPAAVLIISTSAFIAVGQDSLWLVTEEVCRGWLVWCQNTTINPWGGIGDSPPHHQNHSTNFNHSHRQVKVNTTLKDNLILFSGISTSAASEWWFRLLCPPSQHWQKFAPWYTCTLVSVVGLKVF